MHFISALFTNWVILKCHYQSVILDAPGRITFHQNHHYWKGENNYNELFEKAITTSHWYINDVGIRRVNFKSGGESGRSCWKLDGPTEGKQDRILSIKKTPTSIKDRLLSANRPLSPLWTIHFHLDWILTWVLVEPKRSLLNHRNPYIICKALISGLNGC